MHTTGAPHPATTSTPVPSRLGGNPVRPGRRLRTGIGAAALIGSSLMIGACGSVDSPLDPQPAAAAEAPVAFCRVISLVPNAQDGPLLHRQEPGIPTPSGAQEMARYRAQTGLNGSPGGGGTGSRQRPSQEEINKWVYITRSKQTAANRASLLGPQNAPRCGRLSRGGMSTGPYNAPLGGH